MQATATVPQVVSFPQPTEDITQTELELFLSLRRQLAQLEERIAWHEQRFTERLEQGSTVEAGPLHALIKTFERRTVAWKAVVERELGEAYCKRVLAATKPESYTRLVVEVCQ